MTKDTHEYPTGIAHLLPPVHPGRVLADELRARGLPANSLALALRVPANRISDIVRGQRSVTAETALRLGRYLGTGRSSGSTCRHSTTWHWHSKSSAPRSRKK